MTYVVIEMGVYIVEETNRISTIWFKGYNKELEKPYQMVYGRDRRDRRMKYDSIHKQYKILR
jgi:hypothetical protein